MTRLNSHNCLRIQPIFLLATLLVSLSGCVTGKEESLTNDAAITFASQAVTKSTGVVTDINFEGSQYGVFATKTNLTSGDESEVFANTPQVVEFSNNKWTYEPARNWLPQHAYYFVAFYPISIAEIIQFDNEKAVSITGFDATTQTDLLLSEPYKNATGFPSLINFRFRHLLCNINISIRMKDTDAQITLNHFKFSGMKVTGSYSDRNEPKWTLTGDNYTGPLFECTTAETVTARNKVLFENILMLPQTINEDMLFSFNYTLNGMEYDKQVSLVQKGLTAPWMAGKKITYSLSIASENIEMIPTVEESEE